ncbi:MAG TPA: hypothetical protein VEA78_09745 [Acidimicrobiales bacterium]|nr:hypothetical protein [Acidimicrobiales bacterium]
MPRNLELVVTAEDDLVVTPAAAKVLVRIIRTKIESGPSAA